MNKAIFTTLAMAISLTILGGNMSACALGGSTNWKEEVLLHDGKKIIVERSITRRGRHELGQRPPIGDQSLSFAMPGTGQLVRWEDEYGDDIGSANFNLIMLEIHADTVYLVGSPMGCLSYNKWGRPNPPYVILKNQNGDWKRITLQELPIELKLPNLIISSPDDGAKRATNGFVSTEIIQELNDGFKQPEYQVILREPLKQGELGVSCDELVYHKGAWVGPGDSIGRRMMDKMSK